MLNTLGEVVTCFVALAAALLVPAGIIRAWFPVLREKFASMIMSYREERAPAHKGIAGSFAPTLQQDWQPTTTPDNAVNNQLSGNDVAALIPSEARDIIRMQAKAEVAAKLITTAKFTNKAEAIEFTFGCSRSGRPNSAYQQALRLVEPLINPYPQRTADQERQRAELGLTPR